MRDKGGSISFYPFSVILILNSLSLAMSRIWYWFCCSSV